MSEWVGGWGGWVVGGCVVVGGWVGEWVGEWVSEWWVGGWVGGWVSE